MTGGFHGKVDPQTGESIPGWAACGLAQATIPEAGRSYEELRVART